MLHSMNRLYSHLGRAIAVLVAAAALLLTPVFDGLQASIAQAAPFYSTPPSATKQANPNIDPKVIKGIQDKAEDLGDDAERDIGVTGLKNLKNLPNSIPETTDMIIRQRTGNDPAVQPRPTKEMQRK